MEIENFVSAPGINSTQNICNSKLRYGITNLLTKTLLCFVFMLVVGSLLSAGESGGDPLFNKGAALYSQNKFKAAQETFEKAWKKNPQDAKTMYFLGLSAFGAGDYERAVSALRGALSRNPDDAAVRVRLAESYKKLAERQKSKGLTDKAEIHFRLADQNFRMAYAALKAAVKKEPQRIELHNALGLAALGVEDYMVAVVSFDKVLEANPEDMSARSSLASSSYRLGLAYAQRGIAEKAQENFVKSQQNFAILYDSFVKDLGGKALPKPGDPQYATFLMINMNTAQSAMAARNYAESEKIYRRILDVNPEDGGVWLSLASMFVRSGNAEKAKESYDNAYKILTDVDVKDSKDAQRIYSAAQAAKGAGNIEAAITQYEKLMELNPQNSTALMELAGLYKISGQAEKSEKAYKAAYLQIQQKFMENPANVGLNYVLAKAAIGAKDYEGAVVAYERILTSSPDLHRVRMDLAAAYALLKAYDMAKEEFNTVAKNADDPELAKSAKQWIAAMDSATKKHIIVGQVSTSYTYDSNPRANPVDTTIKTTVGNVHLAKDANCVKDDYSNGYTAVLRHIYLSPVKNLQWRSTFVWFGTQYHYLDKQDVNYYSVKSGPGYRIGKLDVEICAILSAMEKDWKTYSQSHGWEMSLSYPLNNYLMLNGSYKYEMKKVYQDRNTDSDIHSIALRPLVMWGENKKHKLSFNFGFSANYNTSGGDWRKGEDATAATKTTMYKDTYRSKDFGVKYSYDLPYGITPYVNYKYSDVRYTSRSTLFYVPRKDKVHTYGFGVGKKLPNRFSVDLSHQRTRAYSNIPLNDYRRHQTTISVAKDF